MVSLHGSRIKSIPRNYIHSALSENLSVYEVKHRVVEPEFSGSIEIWTHSRLWSVVWGLPPTPRAHVTVQTHITYMLYNIPSFILNCLYRPSHLRHVHPKFWSARADRPKSVVVLHFISGQPITCHFASDILTSETHSSLGVVLLEYLCWHMLRVLRNFVTCT